MSFAKMIFGYGTFDEREKRDMQEECFDAFVFG